MPVAAGSFEYDTGSDTFTGLPFEPKGVIMWTGFEEAADLFDTGLYSQSIGLWSNDGTQYSVSNNADDAAVFATFWVNSGGHVRTSTVLLGLEITGALSNGWTFDSSSWGGGASVIYYYAFGGTTLQAQAGTFDLTTASGTQAVTGVGFEPRLWFNLAGQVSGDGNSITLGAADENLSQWTRTLWIEAIGHSNTCGTGAWTFNRALDDAVSVAIFRECLNPDNTMWEAALASMDADGVTYSKTEEPAVDDQAHYYLAVTDTNPSSYFYAGATAAAATNVSGLAAAPDAVFACSGVAEFDGTNSFNDYVSLGSAQPGYEGAAYSWASDDTNDAAWRGQTDDGVAFGDLLRDQSQTLITRVTSYDADGWTFASELEGSGDDNPPVGWIAARSGPARRRGALPVLGVG